jgi:hypothetical protein
MNADGLGRKTYPLKSSNSKFGLLEAMAATDASVISDPRTSESIRNHLKFFAMKQSSLNFFLLFSSGQKKL